MKKLYFMILPLLVSSYSYAQSVNIPDANFKSYLLANAAINTNGDNEIQFAEAETFTGGIYLYGNRPSGMIYSRAATGTRTLADDGISDLTGIEAFVKLTELTCTGSYLTSLDLSKNIALTNLQLYTNDLSSLDVSKNTQLTYIDLQDNQLTNFDVSQNTSLTTLYLTVNQLASLNLKNGQNGKLNYLITEENPNLSCIQVDNIADAGNKLFWKKDATASYSTNCDNLLPVNLVAFTAKADGNYAILQWQTKAELNSTGFDIYRSGDNGVFVKLGEVLSVDEKQQTNGFYAFSDKYPLNGNNYYKLVQVDNDGKENDLGVRYVTFSLASSTIKIYPNPTENLVSIVFSPNNFTNLQVIDLKGGVLRSTTITRSETSKELSLGAYPAGTYIIMLSGNGKAETYKILKK